MSLDERFKVLKEIRFGVFGLAIAFWVSLADPSYAELTPEEWERVYFTIMANRHELPAADRWVTRESRAVLLGFSHVMNSALPSSLLRQWGEVQNRGVTDLILEVAEESDDCKQFLLIARGLPPLPEFKAKYEIVYDESYYKLLAHAHSSGVRVVCGETPEYAHEDGSQIFHERNEYLAARILRLIQEGRKPLVLIGALHLNPIEALSKYFWNRMNGVAPLNFDKFHANEIDGKYQPSEGMFYPDVFQLQMSLGREVNFKAREAERDPDLAFRRYFAQIF